ncbi:hypothetical protein [Meiothermus sp.]|jgi:hypothetical protein|uniref:hypothetical protein n=1 Tax=Meiothermus sp. TaxID=1955249 RepID=UPI0021DE9F4F|nr:hypothetical protein [Meiothermus sp.]GIW25169.1 MAG: hypothetical protein KatS3mg069_1436 [Meiothermus sp.]
MQMLAEAIFQLEPGQMLVGRTPTRQTLLKLWLHRHQAGFDLYITQILEPTEPSPGPLRNTVGRDLISCNEVLEALHCLEDVYPVEPRTFHNLPVASRTATPVLLALLEEQVMRVVRSSVTGEFGPDDLPAQVVALKPACSMEALESDDDISNLILTDS